MRLWDIYRLLCAHTSLKTMFDLWHICVSAEILNGHSDWTFPWTLCLTFDKWCLLKKGCMESYLSPASKITTMHCNVVIQRNLVKLHYYVKVLLPFLNSIPIWTFSQERDGEYLDLKCLMTEENETVHQIESEMKRLLNIISEDQETILQKDKQVWKSAFIFCQWEPDLIMNFIKSVPILAKYLNQSEQKMSSNLKPRKSCGFVSFGNWAAFKIVSGCRHWLLAYFNGDNLLTPVWILQEILSMCIVFTFNILPANLGLMHHHPKRYCF